jgi:hypothetical protein
MRPAGRTHPCLDEGEEMTGLDPKDVKKENRQLDIRAFRDAVASEAPRRFSFTGARLCEPQHVRHTKCTAYSERLRFAKLLRVADPRSAKAPSPLRSAGAVQNWEPV